jgi:hypothetical protein
MWNKRSTCQKHICCNNPYIIMCIKIEFWMFIVSKSLTFVFSPFASTYFCWCSPLRFHKKLMTLLRYRKINFHCFFSFILLTNVPFKKMTLRPSHLLWLLEPVSPYWSLSNKCWVWFTIYISPVQRGARDILFWRPP